MPYNFETIFTQTNFVAGFL